MENSNVARQSHVYLALVHESLVSSTTNVEERVFIYGLRHQVDHASVV